MKLLPKDEKFFDLFVDMSTILKKAIGKLAAADPSQKSEMQRCAEEIAALEKEGDEKTREIFTRLNRTFITPVDPEDVSEIAASLESLLDDIEALSFRLCAYEIDPRPPQFRELTAGIEKSTDLLVKALETLKEKELDEKDSILGSCREIRELTTRGIVTVRNAVADLYKREKDPIMVMKVREIYEWFETTARRYERFTEIMQDVVAKNL